MGEGWSEGKRDLKLKKEQGLASLKLNFLSSPIRGVQSTYQKVWGEEGEDGDNNDIHRFFGLFLCEIVQEELVQRI